MRETCHDFIPKLKSTYSVLVYMQFESIEEVAIEASWNIFAARFVFGLFTHTSTADLDTCFIRNSR